MTDIISNALEYYQKDARIVPIIGAYYRIPDPEIKQYLLHKLNEIYKDLCMDELSMLGQEMEKLFDELEEE